MAVGLEQLKCRSMYGKIGVSQCTFYQTNRIKRKCVNLYHEKPSGPQNVFNYEILHVVILLLIHLHKY